MRTPEHIAALRRDGDAFEGTVAEIAGERGWEVPVPTCPGWDLAALVWHVCGGQHFWGEAVRLRAQEPGEVTALGAAPAHDELLGQFRAGYDRLVATLESSDPAVRVWTWAGQQDVAFVARRVAVETALHRTDVELVAGRPGGVDPTLASDGIDEFLFYRTRFRPLTTDPLGGSVHLHCTDVAGEWLVRDGDDGDLVITREHAKGSCALRGPASDLLMALWRRLPLEAIDVIGERDVAERFVARSQG